MSAAHALAGQDDRRARGAQAISYGLAASTIRDRAGIEAIADRWLGLEAPGTGFNLFQSLGWARAIFDFERERGNAAFDPVIATVSDGRRLVGVLPLERIRTGARSLLVPLGHGFAQTSDALVDADRDAGPVVAHLLRAAASAVPSDGISLLKVRDGSALAQGLPQISIRTGAEQGAPYVALDGFADFARYFATVRTKTRKNMRNARNRLEREGPVEHKIIEDAAERQALIERTLEGRAERLKEQGLTSRAFRDSGFRDFCTSLVERTDIELRAFSLQHQGRPLAEQWGFVHGGRYYAYVANRDFSHSDESPGKLQLSDIIRTCADQGLKGCDLGVPAMPYKLTFATETIVVRDYALPLTRRGWAMFRVWDVLLRPSLKRLVLALPAGLRSALMRLAGHGH
ncbi:CelD/BcsL family acetyltransferase involved in cellulose biosynthesis [Devosia subaequoris]|uniref:CelD/BcsL family acetyltransferase involved in cellulose biosynthesis n=1 Tax=Devosia subaequoris TaxID=395930 RepID=A0A7W6IPS5_9HYPH|nr:GNAT family N-acetyltransferase [Devosia subaequoris]MBB4053505.1 CelD/BcsL family acetyltransferase involved in cellulose biosynthesis [Devosia subaequoris]MCP1210881.1 GNAT family N-acetyltransferase [Devosia subaequoris]